jgi:hypothetical protein
MTRFAKVSSASTAVSIHHPRRSHHHRYPLHPLLYIHQHPTRHPSHWPHAHHHQSLFIQHLPSFHLATIPVLRHHPRKRHLLTLPHRHHYSPIQLLPRHHHPPVPFPLHLRTQHHRLILDKMAVPVSRGADDRFFRLGSTIHLTRMDNTPTYRRNHHQQHILDHHHSLSLIQPATATAIIMTPASHPVPRRMVPRTILVPIRMSPVGPHRAT